MNLRSSTLLPAGVTLTFDIFNNTVNPTVGTGDLTTQLTSTVQSVLINTKSLSFGTTDLLYVRVTANGNPGSVQLFMSLGVY